MNKTIIIATIFGSLAIMLIYYKQQADINHDKAENYRHNFEILSKRIRKIYDEKIKLEEKNRGLEEASVEDKNIFDWSYDISHTSVIKRLQQN